ncbi:MAG: transcription antitermination factor NusB [Elusimicrobia bacterium]|nr:transcription antitermination factor NusB [Elusimicrobiota bacterium]
MTNPEDSIIDKKIAKIYNFNSFYNWFLNVKKKKMGTRRQGREATLQMLYLCDTCGFSRDEVIPFSQTLEIQSVSRDFALELFTGAWDKKELLDSLITKCAENWDLARMAVVDRNILRMAAFEIIGMPETPINVVIDEAVEIAKKYSTSDSSKFVNGILDKLKTERKKTALNT